VLRRKKQEFKFRHEKESNMKLRPLDDRVVVKQSDAKEKTAGGIYLPDTAKEKPQIGKIVATGPGKMLDDGKRGEMSVKKNDRVIYGKYMGNEVEIDGEKYVILREGDILGIVEK
jgi:chaperonin GroES